VAVSPERSDEFEKILYKNARDPIDQKFAMALSTMPPRLDGNGAIGQ
jgi:hypothetical protein